MTLLEAVRGSESLTTTCKQGASIDLPPAKAVCISSSQPKCSVKVFKHACVSFSGTQGVLCCAKLSAH